MEPISLERVAATKPSVLVEILDQYHIPRKGNEIFQVIMELRDRNRLYNQQVELLRMVNFWTWGEQITSRNSKELSNQVRLFGLEVDHTTRAEAWLLASAQAETRYSTVGIERHILILLAIIEYYCKISNPQGLYDHFSNYNNSSNDEVVLAMQLFRCKYDLPVNLKILHDLLEAFSNQQNDLQPYFVHLIQIAIRKRSFSFLQDLIVMLMNHYPRSEFEELVDEISFLDENFDLMLENYLLTLEYVPSLRSFLLPRVTQNLLTYEIFNGLVQRLDPISYEIRKVKVLQYISIRHLNVNREPDLPVTFRG